MSIFFNFLSRISIIINFDINNKIKNDGNKNNIKKKININPKTIIKSDNNIQKNPKKKEIE